MCELVMRIYLLHYLVVLVWLAVARVADCCGRKTTTTTEPVSPQTSTPLTTLPPENHRLQCTDAEAKETQCLNDGKCYAIKLGDIRAANCHCPNDWTGDRCQEASIDIDFFFITERMRTANLAAGVTFAIVVCFAVLLAIYIYIRWRRKQQVLKPTQEEGTTVPFADHNNVDNEKQSSVVTFTGKDKGESDGIQKTGNSVNCSYDGKKDICTVDLHCPTDVPNTNGWHNETTV